MDTPRRMAPDAAPGAIQIYLIDDHLLIRDALRGVIADEPDLLVVGEAGTAADALRETEALKPDVVLVDLNMPDRDGIELLRRLRAQVPAARLLVLSADDDDFRVAEALRAGAHGYLVKTSPVHEVIDGIRRVAVDGALLDARAASAAVRALGQPIGADTGVLDALSPRERQVMRLLASGVSTRDAATKLTLSAKTIETHRSHIYAKLDCKSAAELTRIAVRAGLIVA